jgi:hypothetical protein
MLNRQKSEIRRLTKELNELDKPKFADKFFLHIDIESDILEISKAVSKPLLDPKKFENPHKSQREEVQVFQGRLRQIWAQVLKVIINEKGEYDRLNN